MLKPIAKGLACVGLGVLLIASPLASASTKQQNHDRMGELLGEIEALKPNRNADPAATARFNALQSELRTLQASLGGDLPCATGDAVPGRPGIEGVAVTVPAGCTPTATTFTNTTPVAVPTGPAVVTSTINVTGAGVYLWDLNVRTALPHTFAADLDITIQSPAGTVVTLTTDNGAGNDDVFNGTLWDDSANPSGQVPYTSNNGLVTDHPYAALTLASPLAPEEALSAFVGENPNGTWTITISDDLAGDGGSLNSWSLEMVTFAAPVVAAPAQTFTQTTPVAIPTGPDVVSSTLAVSGLTQRICSMRLTTTLPHTFAADIDATLTSPSGTVVTLTTDNGAGNDNVFNGTLWDADANPAGQVPYSTNNGMVNDHAYVNLTLATPLVAEESFGAFLGQDGNGTWTLTISDDLAGDGGSLDEWALEFVTCTCNTPPTIAYNPTTGSNVAFTGVTTIGTIGNGSITATPSGGIGTGPDATTTINTCTLGGANPGSFAGAAAINLSFVGNTTTPQNLALTCTSQQTAQTATLTCNETRGTAAPVQRQWPLTCPAGTTVAPTIAYNPATGTPVGFTGVTTIGTTGNGSIAATPSGGLGTGAGATTTINTCTLGGTNPGSFAGAAAINLSFVGNTTTAQNLALTCTSAATAQAATLTCNETRGTAAPVQRQWPLNCPAGTAVAPTIAYNPNAGSPVNFTGVTTIGTTGNGTIAATPSGGIGTGAGATTTINTCTLGGTNPGSFAGAAAINLSFVGNTTTPQNLALTCTSAATAQTATLTCNETRGTAAAVQRQWPLNCPAGTLLPLTSNPVSGTTVNLTGISGGTTNTSTITVLNPNPIAVALTCTAPAFPFTASPLAFSIPASSNTPVTVGISPTLPGNYTGTLNCTIAGSSQVLSFSLAGSLAAPIAVNATSAWSLMVLMLALFGFAVVAVRRQG